MTGRVVHFEVPYDDAERARGFYAGRVRLADPAHPGARYDIVSTGPVGDQGMPTEPGFIGGGMTRAATRSRGR